MEKRNDGPGQVHELKDLKVTEVSFVSSPANNRELAVFKSAEHDNEDDTTMTDTPKPSWSRDNEESAHQEWERRARKIQRGADAMISMEKARVLALNDDAELRKRLRSEPTPRPEREPATRERPEAVEKIEKRKRELLDRFPHRFDSEVEAWERAYRELRKEAPELIEKSRAPGTHRPR